jgi:hypothetical protein
MSRISSSMITEGRGGLTMTRPVSWWPRRFRDPTCAAARRVRRGAGWRRCAMAKRPRCAECRRRYTPAATPGDRQRTCGPECRLARRRRWRGRGDHAILRAAEASAAGRAPGGAGSGGGWVRMSRAGFGGDPSRVTGQSASDRGGSGAAALMRARTDQGNVVQEPSNTSGEHSGTGIGRGSLDAQRDKLRASCKLNDIDRVNRHRG